MRHVEVVSLGAGRMLLVVITSSGRVEQRIVEVAEEPDDQLLSDLRARVIGATLGRRLPEASLTLADMIESFGVNDRPIVTSIVTALTQTFSNERSDERLAVGGTANLARFGADFDSAIRPVLEALEEQVVLLKLLGEATTGVSVRIGHETGHEALSSTAVVATGYGSAEQALATLGTVGPTRIDYPSTISAVAAVSRYIGRTLTDTWSLDH